MLESKVSSWLDCGMSCLDTQFCTGFNYNKNSKKNDINCQISHDSNHEFLKVSSEDNDWSFYQGNGDRMVRIIGKYSRLPETVQGGDDCGAVYITFIVAIVTRFCAGSRPRSCGRRILS